MAIEKIHVVWLQGQGCTGDTVSLLNASHPNLLDILTGFIPAATGITLDFHPTVALWWGEDVQKVLEDAAQGKLDPFVMVLEGSIPSEETAKAKGGFWCGVGEEKGKFLTLNDWINRLSKRCAAAVAIGTCASFGGIPKGRPNPTGAKGLLDYLGRGWKSTLGLPVICVPGCPAHGEHQAEVLALAVLAARGLAPVPELDEWHRPKAIFAHTNHENCPRGGFYGMGKYAKDFGEPYCVGLLGCKGPISHCDASRRGFVEGAGGCTKIGSICIGCTEPDFPDGHFTPMFEELPTMMWVKELWGHITSDIGAGFKKLSKRRI